MRRPGPMFISRERRRPSATSSTTSLLPPRIGVIGICVARLVRAITEPAVEVRRSKSGKDKSSAAAAVRGGELRGELGEHALRLIERHDALRAEAAVG